MLFETKQEEIDNLFEKFRLILPAGKQMADKVEIKKNTEISETNYVRYGFSNVGTVLLTSDIHTSNYTMLAQKYESEYLYTYILELYKKFLFKKINYEFNQSDITDDEFGKILNGKWHEYLEIEEIFFKLKNKYDILYKKYNVEQFSKKNGKFAIAIVVLILIGVINLLLQLFQ